MTFNKIQLEEQFGVDGCSIHTVWNDSANTRVLQNLQPACLTGLNHVVLVMCITLGPFFKYKKHANALMS